MTQIVPKLLSQLHDKCMCSDKKPAPHLNRMPRWMTHISPGATRMRPNSVVTASTPCNTASRAAAELLECSMCKQQRG